MVLGLSSNIRSFLSREKADFFTLFDFEELVESDDTVLVTEYRSDKTISTLRNGILLLLPLFSNISCVENIFLRSVLKALSSR